MINDHKATTELTNRVSKNDSERGEWKIQLVIQNNCISTKDFEETHIMYSASKPVEIFIGSDTNDTINRLVDTLLQRFQQAIETSNARGNRFTHESVALLYYYFQKIEIKRAESYITSPDWLAHKEATAKSKK